MRPDEGSVVEFSICRYNDRYQGNMTKTVNGQKIGKTLTNLGPHGQVYIEVMLVLDAVRSLGFKTSFEDRS